MGVFWGVVAPSIAIAVTFGFVQAPVVLTGAIRNRDYRRFEDKSRDSFARQFPLPTVDPSPAEERRKALSPFLETAHKAASAAQTTYHKAVVRSAGCLVLAFLALALDALPPEDWPLKAWMPAQWRSMEYLLTCLDVIAILFVLILFLYGRSASPRWIAARAGTELLRQYQFLSVIFPSASSAAPVGELKSQFEDEAELVAARVQDGAITDVVARIERFWSERRSSIENRALAEMDIPADALLVYLQRRARRQLGWFADSKARLEHIAEQRNILLLERVPKRRNREGGFPSGAES